jgi:hypothetical protein
LGSLAITAHDAGVYLVTRLIDRHGAGKRLAEFKEMLTKGLP